MTLTATRSSRANAESRAVEHVADPQEELSPKDLEGILDSYAEHRWGPQTQYSVPDPAVDAVHQLDGAAQHSYWEDRIEQLNLDGDTQHRLNSAREYATLVFDHHRQDLAEFEASIGPLDTDDGRMQYLQANVYQAVLDIHQEQFTAAIANGDAQSAAASYSAATRMAYDHSHDFDVHNVEELHAIGYPAVEAYNTALTHLDWLQVDDTITSYEDANLPVQHLRVLSQVVQRATINDLSHSSSEQYDAATDQTLADDSRHAADVMQRIITGHLRYEPIPGAEFPELPVQDPRSLTNEHISTYIEEVFASAPQEFLSTWHPATQHLVSEFDELRTMQSYPIPGIQGTFDAKLENIHEAMQALDTLMHPVDYPTLAYENTHDPRQESFSIHIDAMRERGLDDRRIAQAWANETYSNGTISERAEAVHHWSADPHNHLDQALDPLRESGIIDYLAAGATRNPQADQRRALQHELIASNPTEEILDAVAVLNDAENHVITELAAAIERVDPDAIIAALEDLAQLEADFAPVESINERRQNEAEAQAEHRAVQAQAYQLRQINTVGTGHRAGSGSDFPIHFGNREGIDHMMTSRGTNVILDHISSSRYHGHDEDLSQLQESAQRWQQRMAA